MRSLLLTLGCFTALVSFSQQQKTKIFKPSDIPPEIWQNLLKLSDVSGAANYTHANPPFALNTRPGVYSLAQDNMLCIVPDRKAIANIPNAFGKVDTYFITTIPNGIPGRTLPPSTGK